MPVGTRCINIIVFISAFLLFQIELIIAKVLLFKFGGTYTVWGAAIVFFQGALLSGYLYSHFVIKKLGISRYRYLHLALFSLTLFFLPVMPSPLPVIQNQFPIVINVFWHLLGAIGLAFFALSTICIIFQSYLAESELPGRLNPYTLYAASNLGALTGLLTYPFLFEVFFNINTQVNIWKAAYFILFGLQLVAFKLIGLKNRGHEPAQILSKISFKAKLHWLLLSSAGVIMFLSVTNIITYEITPMPLLWILPLCIYLISFILNFKEKPYCPANIDKIFYFSVSLNILLYFFLRIGYIPNIIAMPCLLFLLAVTCMFCQSRLSKHKPVESGNLTTFYLVIASGGFLGGIMVSWIMPLISAVMTEYLFGILIIFIALFINENTSGLNPQKIRLFAYFAIFILIWRLTFAWPIIIAFILLIAIVRYTYTVFAPSSANIASLAFILLLSCQMDFVWASNQQMYIHRNYYGIYKVCDTYNARIFSNGNIIHGAQYLNKEKELEPLTYYHHRTPAGKIMTSNLFDFRRIGIIGLGIGTLSAYGKPNQTLDFFELDPDVFKIAYKYFTFLKKSTSKINYLFGDARLRLAQIPDKRYELFVVDAFSGDSISAHLLTTDAIKEYLRHTTATGIILFHISNRYFNLIPVLLSNAEALNLRACASYNNRSPKNNAVKYGSLWFAITQDTAAYKKLRSKLKWRNVNVKKIKPWTDQYSNLLAVFKMKSIFSLSRN